MTRALAVAGGLVLAAYVAAIVMFPKPGGRVVTGDATHQFVQLRSMAYDRDLHFQNEYVRLYGLESGPAPGTDWVFTELTATGHVRNYMPVGPAMLWAPLYLLASGILALTAALAGTPGPTGYEPVLQLMPGVTGILASVGGAWITCRWIVKTHARAAAPWAVAGIWLGSHALYYTLVSPTYSHAPSMLTGAAFFAHWWRWRTTPDLRAFFVAGLLAGAAALMRWQDALWLAVPAIEALRWQVSPAKRITGLAVLGIGWIVVFSPQMLVWKVLYGRAFTVPQGAAFMEWGSPNLVEMLVSANHGLFSWAPILVLACAGLWMVGRRDRSLALPLAVVLLSAWYVNAAVADWWAGEAYGARRFLSLAPLFAVGLAHWLAGTDGRVSPMRAGVTAVAIGLNGLLLFQYQVFMKGWRDIAPYPRGFVDLWLMRFVVPFRVLGRWWT